MHLKRPFQKRHNLPPAFYKAVEMGDPLPLPWGQQTIYLRECVSQSSFFIGWILEGVLSLGKGVTLAQSDPNLPKF